MYPKTFFANSLTKQRNGKCFVVMPFAEGFDGIYAAIQEAVEGQELSFTCSRADELQGGGHIIEGILQEIAESEVIVADLTGRNPNVFYELGIAQMVKEAKKIILLSQDRNSIPFDVQEFRCIIYRKSPQGVRKLKKEIVAGIRAVAEEGFRFKVHANESYRFPHKVMGADHCAYDFAIEHSFFAVDGGKFFLSVNQHVVGEAPKVISNRGHGLSVGERLPLPAVDWDIELESVQGNDGWFSFQRRLASARNR